VERGILRSYFANEVPGYLDDLGPEERHQFYKMLRMEVLAHPDKSLEVSGAILGGGEDDPGEGPDSVEPGREGFDAASPGVVRLGALVSSRTYESQNTQPWRLRFRALLAEDGHPRVQLHTA
jgi:hypothetical protein